ncbi:MAG: hypothetical protein VXX31_05435 [Planctomycetota bacterium]|nr:hypothetical protein [Planctomycetota bacterium]
MDEGAEHLAKDQTSAQLSPEIPRNSRGDGNSDGPSHPSVERMDSSYDRHPVAALVTFEGQGLPDAHETRTPSILEDLAAEMNRLAVAQKGIEKHLQSIENTVVHSKCDANMGLYSSINEILENALPRSHDLHEFKAWSQQVIHQSETSAMEYRTLQLELTRIRSDQAELKAQMKAVERVYLEPNDPAIHELRVKLDQLIDSSARFGLELQNNLGGESANKPNHLTELYLREVSKLNQSQLESKLELRDLQKSLTHHALPMISELTSQLDQGFAEVNKLASDFSTLRSLVFHAGQESSGEMVAAESLFQELSRLHHCQQEVLRRIERADNENTKHETTWQNLVENVTQLREDLREMKAGTQDAANVAQANTPIGGAEEEALVDRVELLSRVSRLEQERDELAVQLIQLTDSPKCSEEDGELQNRLGQAERDLADALLKIEELTRDSAAGNEQLVMEISRLEEEKDHLQSELRSAKADPQTLESNDPLLDQLYDLREELRQSQEEVARLEVAVQNPADPKPVVQGDWESQKRALLAQLESEDVPDDDRSGQLISMREVISATDEVVEAKNREVSELKQLLALQSDSIGEVAVGAAAIDEIFNHDDLIQQERASLEKMKAEWREKLSQAEIEVSMERAKIARERKELEAEFERLQDEKKQTTDAKSEGKNSASAQKNRWFAKLGLENR